MEKLSTNSEVILTLLTALPPHKSKLHLIKPHLDQQHYGNIIKTIHILGNYK